MEIRKFEINDLLSVIAIAKEALKEQYTGDFLLYLWHINPNGFLVAEKEQKLVGFIIATKKDSQNLRILMLAVDKMFRNLRIGSLLIKKLTYFFPEVRTIFLEVRTDNKEAIRFYKKNGFIKTEKINNFYTDNSAAYLMKKNIF